MKRGKKHKYMNNNIISLSSCLYSPIHLYPPLSSIHVLLACAHARAEGVKGDEGIVALDPRSPQVAHVRTRANRNGKPKQDIDLWTRRDTGKTGAVNGSFTGTYDGDRTRNSRRPSHSLFYVKKSDT